MKKKKQKNFWSASRGVWTASGPNAARSGPKVFCAAPAEGLFFKKALLAFLFLIPFPALAYDNSACWRYAAQQGARPDITCTPLTAPLLQSLHNAPLSAVTALMNEPGMPYPDGTLRYTGDDQNSDGSFLGTIALTVAGGVVVGIDARFANPTQGGAYLYYRWSPQSFCSDLPGGAPRCGRQPPY